MLHSRIPKIIHYCWLSKDPLPTNIKKCMSTWKVMLPDYDFILWDLNNSEINSNQWVLDAFNNKKYAFAADYIRLYAVYNYGGIYLDTDVEVIKSFDELLHLPYFIGSEGNDNIEAGVIGAEKKSKWVGDCLLHYKNRSFVLEDGTFDMLTLPKILKNQIQKHHTIQFIISFKDFEAFSESQICVLPHDFFCTKFQMDGKIIITNNTYCIHHFAMSWIPFRQKWKNSFKMKLMNWFGSERIQYLINLFKKYLNA